MTKKVDHSAASSRVAVGSNRIVVGLDNDLLAVKEQLCGESSRLQVVPIVGMGGIGKTTLARNAYHDPLIRDVFHIGGWVTVSQSYSVDEILTTLRQSFKHFDAEEESEIESTAIESQQNAAEMAKKVLEKRKEEFPEDQVHKTLKGRKYLIVIDDIWSTKAWDDLKKWFPDDGNGSRVILTTRRLDVATYPGDGSRPHEMQLMNEDQSWDLLRQIVFADGICDNELEDIGMAIARSCEGLPLAMVVIAGLLSTVERTRAVWEEIVEKVKSAVAERDGQLERILSLSYIDLPRHLRQCFVYMGGFPEDREIYAEKLVKLWAAEGFVGCRNASKSLEEEAEGCLQDLVRRSLVLVGKTKPNGEIKSCSLHDLMRDLCLKKADEDNFPLYDINVLETLVESTFEDVNDLRVIDWEWDLSDKSLYVLIRDQIFWLSGLRYLVLDCCEELPADVANLENLQTLIIHTHGSFVRLPPYFWRMQQLRHLISSFDQLPIPGGQGTPAACFPLVNRQTLPEFPLGNLQSLPESPLGNLQTLSEVSNLECSHGFVKMLPNIKKLGLIYCRSHDFEARYYLNNLEDWYGHARDYRLTNLRWLHKLEKLKVQVYPGFQGKLHPVFPQSLKKLSLSGWKHTSWCDMTIIGSLPNLQVLKLRDFGGQFEKWETTEDQFARLNFLLIERCDLRDWITERDHFPCLKWLHIHLCWQLREIPLDIGDIPTLELIEVKQGDTSLLESARQIEEEQEEFGNDSLKVRYTKKRIDEI